MQRRWSRMFRFSIWFPIACAVSAAAPAKADGIQPTAYSQYEYGTVTDPGAAPCRRYVQLSYLRPQEVLQVSQYYFLIEPCETDHVEYPDATDPQAIVILFTGGNGVLNIPGGGEPRNTNFVVRNRYAFEAAGPFVVAVIDAATDFIDNALAFQKDCKRLPPDPRPSGNGLRSCRFSDAHMIDVANVIQSVRFAQRDGGTPYADLPVWLVGTSRGPISVVAAGTRIDPAYGPDGLVLTAPVINDRDLYEDTLDADLESITVPVIVAVHEGDECSASDPDGHPTWNPGGIGTLVGRLTSSAKVKFMKPFSGGYPAVGEDCGPLAPHGFFGLDDKVIPKISQAIVDLSE